MTAVLPASYTARAMRVEDAGVIAEWSGRYTSALLGFAKHSAEDVANYLRDPGFDPSTDGWVVLDGDGEFAGSATAMVASNRVRVNAEVLSEDPRIVQWLVDRVVSGPPKRGLGTGGSAWEGSGRTRRCPASFVTPASRGGRRGRRCR